MASPWAAQELAVIRAARSTHSVLLCSPQQMLMRQQNRIEERVQDIEGQLYKLESDKQLVEVVSQRSCLMAHSGSLCVNAPPNSGIRSFLTMPGFWNASQQSSAAKLAQRDPGREGFCPCLIVQEQLLCMTGHLLPEVQLTPPTHWLCSQLVDCRDKVQHLKEEVRTQYQRMHQLLEEDLSRSLEVLDKAHSSFCRDNSAQALQLNERRQDAKKLLSSVQVVFDKTEDINFMKVPNPHTLGQ
ncbi:hypothetical protein JZ751_019889 [Albula glossodonta]|uniref:Uncharacterized protein n=1 Tax=Albula glossodonta TaxID=121402 RepID=A0A8T2NL84_9TELE|nr:hypothetical protein JZ751_019889 [Albula glossodonta]